MPLKNRIQHIKQRLFSLFPKRRKQESYIREYYRRLAEGDDEVIPRQWTEAPFEEEKLYAGIESAIGEKAGKRRVLIHHQALRMAAVLATIVVTLACLYFWQRTAIEKWINPVAMLEKETAAGQMLVVTLSDGSKVWINAGSRLVYPEQFKGATREVELTGEAYFEIAGDAAHPFIVHSGRLETQVLGTSFNIKAYPGNTSSMVTVLTGSVKVTAKNTGSSKQAPVVLKSNERVIYSKSTGYFSGVQVCDAGDAVAWKAHRLVYTQVRLGDVLEDMSRLYNITVQADTAVLDCIISADFTNETPDAILAVLAELTNSHLIKQGNYYRLTGKGCQTGGKGS